MLVEKVAQANNSFLGKHLNSLASKIGGPSRAAFLNILCTAILGFIITYSIYELGGIYASLPTAAFTAILLAFISISIISHNANKGKKLARKLLIFAIVFSLPFGLLSLPLLHRLSSIKSQPH